MFDSNLILENHNTINNTKHKLSGLQNLSKDLDREMHTIREGFPVEIFPQAIQKLINSAKHNVGFDMDYFSTGILSICATAIGNSVHLHNGTYKSKPILWLAIIGSRGTGKTHPLSFAKHPIEQKDNQTFIEYQSLMQEYELKEKETRGKKPQYGKFILKDFTPEKLAESLQFNEKGILIFQDELMGWINSFDKYKKGNDQQLYLELFNGNELTVDRITKDPIRILETNVNILGGMQPEIVKQLAKNNRSEDGFLDRFLFVFPKNLEPHLFTGSDIPEIHKENYKRLITNLLEIPRQTVKTTSANIEIYKHWQHKKAIECFHDRLERSIQAKMETYVWRLALIIEMMQQAVTGNFNISLQDDSLKKAIALVEYFRLNALRVHDKIRTTNPLEDLSPLQLDLYKSLPSEFKRADALPIFEIMDISVRTGDRFLQNEKLFDSSQTSKQLKTGNYKKKL
ncbi:MAG: hypothetical protein CL526_12325 [Aequorivita sp.]|nr:hypothetical protein [Aequorivita sp.]|tara:strand:+ start:60601 stop:61968 length:1368 start_codon:yes stop_codon:yes gene_type:complete